MKYNLLSIVIPAYNEEKSISELLNNVFDAELGIRKEIIVVNDASKDETPKILERYASRPDVKVFHNKVNSGKTQTVKNGLSKTTGDLVVIQDADLEYDPNDLREFIRLFQEDEADLVYGNRFGKKNKVIYLANWIGNTGLSYISAFFTGLRSGMWTRDMEVCYKMAPGKVFRELGETIVSKSTFGLEPEISAKFSKFKLGGKHLRFRQVPISYYPRTLEEGKQMNAFRDGFKALIEILRFNLT